ncbi:phage tail protein [Psychrilyobacter sp.]|uniref:phage tail protein n=1 Tax=Psychrilyobacter sp. TaxID=2586924 RepID=UPI0030164DB0
MIGILGDIQFKVSFDGTNNKILNFSDLKLSGGANYEEHKRRGLKPALEFIDLKTDVVNLKITLRTDFGVNPLEIAKKLNSYKNTGEVLKFLLGNKPVGNGEFVITSCNYGYEYITNNGLVRNLDVSLSLKEYTKVIYENIEIITKTKQNTEKKIVHEDFNQGAIER